MFERFFSYFLPLNPFNRTFGFSSGTPIDRYFIETFLRENSGHISGRVLEIAENTYTKKFGKDVTESLTLGVAASGKHDIVCDLEKGYDRKAFINCFILTQTLPFVYDVSATLKTAYSMIENGGTLLITVPGITQISRYDHDRWGQYWSFTDRSLKKLIDQNCEGAEIQVNHYGNAQLAAAFLYGIPLEKINRAVLSHNDPDYQLTITARVTKGAPQC